MTNGNGACNNNVNHFPAAVGRAEAARTLSDYQKRGIQDRCEVIGCGAVSEITIDIAISNNTSHFTL